MGFIDNWFGNWFGNQHKSMESFYTLWSTSPMFNDYSQDVKKLEVVFTNPAVLKVFTLCCDLFSLGEVYVYKNGIEQKSDPFLRFINNPNKRQQKQQFLWDFCFWNMIGNDYLYLDSLIVEKEKNKAYFLEPSKIDWPLEMDKKKDKLFLSESSENELQNTVITYRFADGTTFPFKFKNLIHIPDLTSGTGNWFKGPSRIDALHGVVSNSDEAIKSKNVNLRMSRKYMVSGKASEDDVTRTPLTNTEKMDIERKTGNENPVTAVKSMVDIKRFVENIANLKLDDSYLSDYFIIGSLYGVPKDVLEAFNSGTFENQEKARGALVSYCLQPRANAFMGALNSKFNAQGVVYVMDWEHLPFMQVFAKERAETTKVKADSLILFMKAGVNLKEINAILDTNFTELNYETANRAANEGANSSQNSNAK